MSTKYAWSSNEVSSRDSNLCIIISTEVLHVHHIITCRAPSLSIVHFHQWLHYQNIHHKPIHLVADAWWNRPILLPLCLWSPKLVCQQIPFFARNAMWSLLGFLFCDLTLWLILGMWLIDVSSSSSFASLVVAFVGATISWCSLLICTLLGGGGGSFLLPSSTSCSNSTSVIWSIGAFVGCCYNASSNCLDASRIMLAGASCGVAMAWCLNLTVPDICSAPVDFRMPLNDQ